MEGPKATASSEILAAYAADTRKRRWTTQMMKTWVASDPSTSAPVIEHRDPKAAARAEKKKRRKIEQEEAARAAPKPRLIRPPDILPNLSIPIESYSVEDMSYFEELNAVQRADQQTLARSTVQSSNQADHKVPKNELSIRVDRREAMKDSRFTSTSYAQADELGTENREGQVTLTSATWSSPEATHAELDEAEVAYDKESDDRGGHVAREEEQNPGEEGAAVDAPVDHEGNMAMFETEEHDDDVEMNSVVGGNEGKLLEMEKTTAHERAEGCDVGDASHAGRADMDRTRVTMSRDLERGGEDVDETGDVGRGQVQRHPSRGMNEASAVRQTKARNMEYRERTSEGEERPGIDKEEHRADGSSRDRTEGKSTPAVESQTTVHVDRERGVEATDEHDGKGVRNAAEDTPLDTTWRRFGPQGHDIRDYVPHFHNAPTVQWPGELTTLGPYIPKGTHRKGARNKLKWDLTYTRTVARKFKSSRERPDLCMHAKFTNEFDAVKLIRRCMAQGIPLVFDEYPDSVRWAASASNVDEDPFMNPMRWSDDEVEGVVGADLNTPRDFQDAGLREDAALEPYMTATLQDFHSWLKEPGIVRCILDLTCGFPQSDELTNRVADNVIQSVPNTYGNKYSGHYLVPADMLKTQDWFLLHTSGFLTFGHIDGSGMATSAQIRGSGMKEWIVFKSTGMPTPKPEDSRSKREALADELVDRTGDLIMAASNEDLRPPARKTRGEGSKWDIDGCVIELRPGMKYFQPSGTVHAAYTPIPTAASGKHFFTYDDLHRVEVARRLQVVKKGITNHNHNCGVQMMLISMAASLPMKAKSGRVFYRKPLIAMALMLTRPGDYMLPSKRPFRMSWEADDDEGQYTTEDEDPPLTDEEKAKENKERRAEWETTERLRSKRWFTEGTAFDRLAHTVASRILKACKCKYPGDKRDRRPKREYIFEGASWEDPGPILDAHGLTYDLVVTHVDDLQKADTSDDTDESGSELTDLDDL